MANFSAQSKPNRIRFTALHLIPTGSRVASGGYDNTVKVWRFSLGSLSAFSRSSKLGSQCCVRCDRSRAGQRKRDNTVRLWDANTGEGVAHPRWTLGSLWSVAFHPRGNTWRVVVKIRLSTFGIWRVAEGSTRLKGIQILQRAWRSMRMGVCSLLRGAANLTTRSGLAWRHRRMHCSYFEPQSHASTQDWVPPNVPLLATVGSDLGTPEAECDRVIHIWELDLAVLLGASAVPAVTYTSAKVVLVGESNVGNPILHIVLLRACTGGRQYQEHPRHENVAIGTLCF